MTSMGAYGQYGGIQFFNQSVRIISKFEQNVWIEWDFNLEKLLHKKDSNYSFLSFKHVEINHVFLTFCQWG